MGARRLGAGATDLDSLSSPGGRVEVRSSLPARRGCVSGSMGRRMCANFRCNSLAEPDRKVCETCRHLLFEQQYADQLKRERLRRLERERRKARDDA